MAWMMLYIDRSITGPVVAWMIENNVSFLASAPLPHALGGIIGSMFFAGYMLTQFPAGYLGDKYGYKTLIVISLAWSAVTTFASGLARDLQSFVAFRILTGLGEGAYYSNDRAVVQAITPAEKRGLGMGIVFVGLAAGLTIATLFTPGCSIRSAFRWVRIRPGRSPSSYSPCRRSLSVWWSGASLVQGWSGGCPRRPGSGSCSFPHCSWSSSWPLIPLPSALAWARSFKPALSSWPRRGCSSSSIPD